MRAPAPGEAILRDGPGGGWLLFRAPVKVLVAREIGEVLPLLEEAERAVAQGLWGVGLVAYEAAPAFDAALSAHPPGGSPLAWLALYRGPEELDLSDSSRPAEPGYRLGEWRPSVDRAGFERAFDRIQESIAAGDSYQVNYSFRLRADFEGDPWGLFLDLQRGEEAGYAAYIDTGEGAVASASPELFFEIEGDRISSRPMKGTAPRGRFLEEDLSNAHQLATSPKERAENVMVVDMIRNDLGRIAAAGSVEVPRLFEIERYPTVLQMTSTVTARTAVPATEIFRSLFPCASITGAPKVRTSEIIAELEGGPRGIYTGAIGYLAPEGVPTRARFGVAIRTAWVDASSGSAEYGVGGGIVRDSEAEAEWRECLLKSRVVSPAVLRDAGAVESPFRLLETLLWRPGEGFWLIDEHLERLSASALFFDFALDLPEAAMRLAAVDRALPAHPHKIRLLVSRDGGIETEASPLDESIETDQEPLRVAPAAEAVDSADPFLFHKTTRRGVYERALASRPDCDEVLLQNERGELTEAANWNLLVELDGGWWTPPVSSGLLAGTYRARLLADGEIGERVLTAVDLEAAGGLALINSVRGRRRAVLAGASAK